MTRWIALGLALLAVRPAAAQDGIPAKTLADIKAATVFVKLETTRVTGSGSGFVMKVDGDTVLIVTNEHVARPPAAVGPVRKLEVVFNSGKAKDELVLPAEVIAADAERDLAVLRVKGVAKPPKPLDLAAKVELGETMTVYAVGFPFGEALTTTKGNPAPTVGKGSVSSLRENDEGELAVIQIDGDINPGNSGGPVVDGKGRLVGVAVAKVRGTNIGLAIPPLQLTKMLQGRVGASGARVLGVEGGVAEVEITLQFIDPLDKVKTATIKLAKSGGAPLPKGSKPGDIPELTGAIAHAVKIENQKAVLKVKLPAERHFMQVVYSTEAKKDVRTGVVIHDLPALARAGKTAPGVAPANPLPGGAAAVGELTARPVTIAAAQQPGPGVRLSQPVPCLTWTADGKGFYAYDHAEKAVRKFSYPELKEQAKLDVGKACSWLSLSAAGVVLTVAEAQEGWVLDADTLKKGVTFPANKATRAVSAPPLSVAYVADTGNDPLGRGTLRVVDLKTGKKRKEYASADFDRFCGFKTPVLSADGRHLFATGGIEQLVELATDGEAVTFVGLSERLVQGAFQQPVVSGDGKLVCAPSGGGNYKIKASKDGTYTTLVFAPGNLSDPILQLKTGPYPAAVGFDRKAGLIYGQNFQDGLIVMDREGSVLKSFKLGAGGAAAVSQLLPHPDGRKLLVLASPPGFGEVTAYAVEVPAK